MAEASAYVPNNDELSDEVADILIDLDNATPSANEVLQIVRERNASWSVPENRVAKYVDEYNLTRGNKSKMDATTTQLPGHAPDDSKVQKVPPKRPQRTISDDQEEDIGESEADKAPAVPPIPDGDNSNSNDDDDDIVEEADKRSKFMLKGGSHSIQKVLKGEARKKKGFSRFDRRSLAAKTKGKVTATKKPAPAATPATSADESVSSAVLESLGDSYSENIEVDLGNDSDAEEFAAEVERRSKFIAKGGCHSIQKVLAGEARSSGKSGPSRINRKNIPSKQDSNDYDDDEEETSTKGSNGAPRTPVRTISCDSTDSQIEDEANKRSRFMLKGASHSIRNLLSGKAKKEKRGSVLDRRKLHFKHEADAVHYNETPHAKPEEINEARLKAEAEAKAKAAEAKAAKKASRFGVPRRPKRTTTEKEEPSSAHPDDESQSESDAALEAEADKRSLMFKGGSHSIRNLFAGKAKKKDGLNRFNRRKMHFKKEAEAVHYTEKPHLKPAEINKRHQEEAARLRAAAEASANPKKPATAPPMPPRRIRSESQSEHDSKLDLGEETSKRAVYAEIEALHGEQEETESGAADASNGDAEYNTDDDIIEEADKRSKFMMKGGSYSIQKVLRGDARKKKGPVGRLDRRKMHFNKASESMPDTSQQSMPDTSQQEMADNSVAHYSDEDDDDADIIEEADKRSKFMMKGGSYSIQKVLRGDARKKKGPVGRLDRRKMHFKHEAEAIHCHDHDGEKAELYPSESMPDTSQQEMADNSAAQYTDEGGDEDDADIIEEANKRSKFMMKGGSYSIQKVLRGDARKKKGPVNRFDRRKMHFNKASESMPDTSQHSMPDTSQQEMPDSSAAQYTDEDEDVTDIIEEANKRSKFMMKGGSYSIQKVLRGDARKKKGPVGRLDRRKMHFNKASKSMPDTSQQEMADNSAAQYTDEDDDDADIIEEADKRSKFMMKGGSYSIQKVLRGDARKKKGPVGRLDRRKMHFKHEAEAIHCHDRDGEKAETHPGKSMPDTSQQEMADNSAAQYTDEGGDEDDDDIIEEANKRSKFMMKGGSYSIQKVLRGDARKKKGPVGRLDRRKMHFNKASESMPDTSQQSMPDTSQQEMADNSVAHYSDEDDEDADIIEEADKRSKFMMKGGSYSIQKVLRGDARKKKGPVGRLDRRKMHFKHEAEAIHCHDADGSEKENSEAKPDMDASAGSAANYDGDDDADIIEEADKRSKFMMKGGSHSIQKVLRGEARKKKGPVNRFDRRKMHFKKESQPPENQMDDGDESQKSNDSAPRRPTRERPEDGSAEFDDEDADIIEEADKRSKFMMKGGSHSIQKVLRGEARAKKGPVNRFDRRKMHFKHEAEAIHSHDDAAAAKAKDKAPRKPPARIPTNDGRVLSLKSTQAKGDDSEEFDEEELELLAQAENDPRKQMMLKGASHSIRNIFSGKAKKKEKVGEGMQRRTSQLKNKSVRGMTDESQQSVRSSVVGDDDPSVSTRGDDDKIGDRRKRFTLKGASNSIRNLLGRKSGRKEGQRAIDAEIERLHGKEKESSEIAKETEAELDDEDREIEEEANRRSNFIAKGGSYSITKVLSGSARKKKEGVTRFDRRKMHFKKEAEAIHSHDGEVNTAGSPPQSAANAQAPTSPTSPVSAQPPTPPKPPTDEEEQVSSPENASDAAFDDEDDEDADIIEEADKRSKFMMKGGSYSIQKVLRGDARKKKGPVGRLDRRKMHFKQEAEAIHSHDHDGVARGQDQASTPPSDAAPKQPSNASIPCRRVSDGMEEDRANTASAADDEENEDDLELLAQADERTKMMLKGGSHSIRNIFSGKKEKVEGTGFKRRLSQMKKVPSSASSPGVSLANSQEIDSVVDTTQTSSVNLTASPKPDATDEFDDILDEDDAESGDVDRRSKFTLKGASHSIKKVLAGKARTKKESGVSRFDRRRINLKSKTTSRGDAQGKSPGSN